MDVQVVRFGAAGMRVDVTAVVFKRGANAMELWRFGERSCGTLQRGNGQREYRCQELVVHCCGSGAGELGGECGEVLRGLQCGGL